MFDGKYYVDKCLPVGCSISCALFEKFSTFLHWVVENKSGLSTLDHYLDDFLFADAALINDCQKMMDTFFLSVRNSEFPLRKTKRKVPLQNLHFLAWRSILF